MTKFLWTALFLVAIQAGHSYILLTANIDDLRNIGEQVVKSPIVGQVGHIVRRAYDVFSNKMGQEQVNMRADDADNDIVLAYRSDEESNTAYRRRKDNSHDSRDRSDRNDRQHSSEEQTDKPTETFSALGKSASVYLQKIKKIFEKA